MPSKNLLITFVKNPISGQVKTRLAVKIGEDAALSLYKRLIKNIWTVLSNVNVDKAIYYSENPVKNDIWKKGNYMKFQQNGMDIGDRMQNAFMDSFHRGYQKICLIGSDIVGLEPRIISTAFDFLTTRDIVLGPANDGGYYLIGMRTFHPALFTGKEWSTSTVFKDTLNDIEKGGLSFALLPELIDIDTAEDLEKAQSKHLLH